MNLTNEDIQFVMDIADIAIQDGFQNYSSEDYDRFEQIKGKWEFIKNDIKE